MRRRRVLLVSTDPASNLTDVFQMATAGHPISVPLVAGLEVMDLDPQEAAERYRSRVTDPYRGVLPETEIAALEEKLAGACTVEVAAFDTFARLLADPDRDRPVRPGPVRHGPHGPHAATVEPAGRLVRLPHG